MAASRLAISNGWLTSYGAYWPYGHLASWRPHAAESHRLTGGVAKTPASKSGSSPGGAGWQYRRGAMPQRWRWRSSALLQRYQLALLRCGSWHNGHALALARSLRRIAAKAGSAGGAGGSSAIWLAAAPAGVRRLWRRWRLLARRWLAGGWRQSWRYRNQYRRRLLTEASAHAFLLWRKRCTRRHGGSSWQRRRTGAARCWRCNASRQRQAAARFNSVAWHAGAKRAPTKTAPGSMAAAAGARRQSRGFSLASGVIIEYLIS